MKSKDVKPIYLRVDADTRKWLEKQAKRKDISVQSVINQLVLKAMILEGK